MTIPSQTGTNFVKRTRKSRSYKQCCLDVLHKYRRYVSDNDVGLHYRWQQAMLGMFPDIVNTWNPAYTPAQKRIYHMYGFPSLFRETLFYDFYDRCERMINNFKRGDSWCWTEDCHLYLMIEPNTFHLQISLKRITDRGVF